MNACQQLTFVVSLDIVGRMDRVVMINDGHIVSKKRKDKDMVYTVERT